MSHRCIATGIMAGIVEACGLLEPEPAHTKNMALHWWQKVERWCAQIRYAVDGGWWVVDPRYQALVNCQLSIVNCQL